MPLRAGQVIRISDLSTASRPPTPLSFGAAAIRQDTQVPVGQMEVQVTVEVDFGIA